MNKTTRLPMLLGALLICLRCVSPDGTTWGQRPPIKIGFVTDLTGTAAQAAKDMVNGLTMYLDEIGYQMAGRKVELIAMSGRDWQSARSASWSSTTTST